MQRVISPVRLLALACVALPLSLAATARADVSSWLYVGGGAGLLADDGSSGRLVPALQLETGMGTPPADSLIFGGVLQTRTYFGEGTDVALLARGATHSYANGDFGLALDVGPYFRWWGAGSNGVLVGVGLGAPWGITLSGIAGFGSYGATTFGATLGIDLARLTVYRRSGDAWWKNPFPAYRPDEPF